MNKTKAIFKEIVITAPVTAVWKALTDPESIKHYLYGTKVLSDWNEGSAIRFTGEWGGVPYEDKGTITSFKENKVLEYSYWSTFTGVEDVPENYAIVRFELREQDTDTQLILEQFNSPTEVMRENSDKAWSKVLVNMRKLVEARV